MIRGNGAGLFTAPRFRLSHISKRTRRIAMRNLLIGFLMCTLTVLSGSRALARDDLQAVIDKAIKAHGGADKLKSMKGVQTQTQGAIDIAGMTIKFNQEATALLSGKLKEVMKMNVMNMDISVTTVFDGTQGWINANGKTMDMDEKILAAMKDATYMMSLGR